MKKTALLLLLSLQITFLLAQSDIYSRVEIRAGKSQIINMLNQGIALDDAFLEKENLIIAELPQSDLLKLSSLGIDYEVLISDVTAFYIQRNEMTGDYVIERGIGEYPVPEDFELGSMGGFCTYDEMITHLDNMHTKYPDLITAKQVAGTTLQGRDIYWVRLSDNPDQNEDEPEVLYDGLHHAREGIGLQLLLYYMYYLLENYDTDEEVQYLVNNTEMYFIPVINADGYVYNQTTNPNGGGMWRKTRRDNGDGSYGVDPNRNYAYMWGYDNNGSSPIPSDETYRGPYAFSEPCIQTLRDFTIDNEFGIAMNYHSYSNLLLYAWGYTEDPCPDDDIFSAFGQIMTSENGYAYGAGSTTIYPTNGGSDDWMYGEQGEKPLIFAFTPEVGNSNDGFWPSVDRIIPLCQENMYANLMAAHFVGYYASVDETSPAIISSTEGSISFTIKRLGLKDGATFSVYLAAISPEIISTGMPLVFNDLAMLQTEEGSVSFTLDPNIQNGTPLSFLLQVDNGLHVTSDTVNKVFGQAQVLFEDDGSNMSKWTSPKWNITYEASHSAPTSITDSPNANYLSNSNSSVTTNTEIDLSDAVFAVLNFWAKWEIEAGWDYVQVKVSDNGGSTWTALDGMYTKPGNSNQALGQPLYDGYQTDWVKEEIDLSDYLGEQIKIRFTIRSDGYIEEDGFYFDDLTVMAIPQNGVGMPDPTGDNDLYSIHPNPGNGIIFLETSEDMKAGTEFTVFSLTGKTVYSSEILGRISRIDVSGWEPGIYFVRIEGAAIHPFVRKLIVY
ncbi:MAG: immune inhibitor A [Bacteroidetes bacterium]|nr:immune inhibitor A [Bacteroidota bacterium]